MGIWSNATCFGQYLFVCLLYVCGTFVCALFCGCVVLPLCALLRWRVDFVLCGCWIVSICYAVPSFVLLLTVNRYVKSLHFYPQTVPYPTCQTNTVHRKFQHYVDLTLTFPLTPSRPAPLLLFVKGDCHLILA